MNRVERSVALRCQIESVEECSALDRRTHTSSVGQSESKNVDLGITHICEHPMPGKPKNFSARFVHEG
ncbi:hypothetical protein PHAVU_010G151800 [Phaseolus vulgaris]|uniref:Uncharacterized protein n=1 Tax=Phaseolus vulgaris TaxID=3885 RepID=V7AQY7_PHAVU|nr:hypothetical protein PHAVU_010G151800g [Phaseolus vulgaris]ESW07705.1 hypothetical protein PHAVU_010G151800g [Phaseolus vulgaris]